MPQEPRCTVIRDPGGDSIVRVAETTRCTDGSILIVPAGSVAHFALNGEVSAPYAPGRYEINTGVNPFFRKFRYFMTGGDPGITVNVFYVALDMESHMQLGSGEVIFTEKRYRQTIRALAAFSIDFHICDPKLFLSKMVGMHSNLFMMEDITPKLESILCGPIVEEMCRKFENTEIGTINSRLASISAALTPSVSATFSRYGIELVRLQIQHININESDLDHLQQLERTEAEGRMKTDLEKYNLSQIYKDDIHLRTIARATENTSLGSSLGSFAATAAFFRSVPEDIWNSLAAPVIGSTRASTDPGAMLSTRTHEELNRKPGGMSSILPPIRRDN